MAEIKIGRGGLKVIGPDGGVQKTIKWYKGKETKGDPNFLEAKEVMKLVMIKNFGDIGSGDGQSFYNKVLNARTWKKFDPGDDLDEAARFAANYLQKKQMSAAEVAGLLIETNQKLKVGMSLGTMSPDYVELIRQELTEIIKGYYPVNFHRGMAHPKKI